MKFLISIVALLFMLSCAGTGSKGRLPQDGADTLDSPCVSNNMQVSAFTLKAEYPQWFFVPPANAVAAFDVAKAARMDGYDRYCGYKQMRAKGFYFCQDKERFGNLYFTELDSIAFYYIPDTAIDTSSFIVVDSIHYGQGKSFLFSLDSITVSDSKSRLCQSPRWSSASEQGGRVYGYGYYRIPTYNHFRGWAKAESNAIKDLMLKTSAIVVSQEREHSSRWSRANYYDFDLLISDVKVERRWFNPEDGIGSVVVSCHKSQIKRWVDNRDTTASEELSDSVLEKLSEPAVASSVVETVKPETNEAKKRQQLLESLGEPQSISDLDAKVEEEKAGSYDYERESTRRRLYEDADNLSNESLYDSEIKRVHEADTLR